LQLQHLHYSFFYDQETIDQTEVEQKSMSGSTFESNPEAGLAAQDAIDQTTATTTTPLLQPESQKTSYASTESSEIFL
jgi:hypothetical protein